MKPNNTKQEEQDKQLVRATFVCMIMIIMRGEQGSMSQFLMDKSTEQIKQYAEVWDSCANHPIGDIIQRPDFELWHTVAEVRERQRQRQRQH